MVCAVDLRHTPWTEHAGSANGSNAPSRRRGSRPRAAVVRYKRPQPYARLCTPKEDAVTDVVRKGVVLLAIGFAVFYLVTQPERTADVVGGTWDAAVDGFNAIIRFFRRLAN